MKHSRRAVFACCLLLGIAAVPPAHPAPPKKAPAPEKAALPAEEIVAKMEALFDEDENGEVVVSPERFAAILRRKMGRFDELAGDLRRQYPKHPLRWKVLLLEALHLPVRREAGMPAPAGKSARGMFDEILAAADAPEGVKAEASSQRLVLASEDVGAKKMTVDAWEESLARHWKDFPKAGDNASLEQLHVALIQELAPDRLDALLVQLAKHADPAIADMAAEKQAARAAISALKSKPLALKFKAMDGREVDFEKLRGKVILVDFWATWCGPAMDALPGALDAYAKLHDKGFEIVGISLDEDESALRRVLKSRKIAWPHIFDGRGWDSEIPRRFGVDAIPAMWLVDKEGMLVDTDASAGLEAKVRKLLEKQ